jgi:hypothetical protein
LTDRTIGFPLLFGTSSSISVASFLEWLRSGNAGWLLATIGASLATGLQWYLGAKAKIRAEQREQDRLDREAARDQEWNDFLLDWQKERFTSSHEFPRLNPDQIPPSKPAEIPLDPNQETAHGAPESPPAVAGEAGR